MTRTFDPEDFGFVRLDRDVSPGVATYEIVNHPSVNGRADFARLNLYLSQDRDFVTVWTGLIDPVVALGRIGDVAPGADLASLFESYCETLFRGRPRSPEAAAHVLDSVGARDVGGRHARPQVVTFVDEVLRVDFLPDRPACVTAGPASGPIVGRRWPP